MEMQDPPPSKDPKENDQEEEWLFISLKWMKPGAVAAVPLYAEPLRLPRKVTLAQLRDAILEQTTTANMADFHDLVANQKYQMHFVYKGTILKEEENNNTSLRERCVASNSQITLFVVLSNPPPPPKSPAVRPPVRPTAPAASETTTAPAAPPPPRPEPPRTERLPLPDDMMDNLQQQFPEHDIRGLVSTLFSHPDARAQMERSFDLQLAQLDHVPGGMSLLQSLYTQQQDQEERMLFPGSEPTRNAANAGSNDAAIAGATGQAMPNPWGSNRRRRPPPRRTLPTTSPAVRPTLPLPPMTFPPNPWASPRDEMEQLYDHSSTATAVTSESPAATIPADNPWRVDPAQEELLFDMGFTNRARNRSLLQQHDWETAVEMLLREAEDAKDGE